MHDPQPPFSHRCPAYEPEEKSGEIGILNIARYAWDQAGIVLGFRIPIPGVDVDRLRYDFAGDMTDQIFDCVFRITRNTATHWIRHGAHVYAISCVPRRCQLEPATPCRQRVQEVAERRRRIDVTT